MAEQDDAPGRVTLALIGGPGTRTRLEPAIASLPVSVELTEGPAQVVWIDGTRPEWAALAERALEYTPDVVVVSEPVPTDPAAVTRVAEAAQAADVASIVHSRFASSVGVFDLANVLAPLSRDTTLVCLSTTFTGDEGNSGDQIVLDLLLLLRRCGFSPATFEVLERRELAVGFVARTSAGVLVRGSAVRTPGVMGSARLSVFGPARVHRLDAVDAAAGALPSTVSRVDEAGELTLPTVYEDPRRTTLNRSIAIVRREAAAPRELVGLVSDLNSLRQK